MKKTALWFFLGISLATTVAGADGVFWVKLNPRFSYRDAELSCSELSSPLKEIYLVARVDNSQRVVQAQFRDGTDYFLHSAVFTPAEAAAIEVQKDPIGEYWVKRLHLSPQLLVWLFFNFSDGDASLYGCRPPRQLSTLTPAQANFEFKQKDAATYYTSQYKFSGTNVAGKPYAITLAFNQLMMTVP